MAARVRPNWPALKEHLRSREAHAAVAARAGQVADAAHAADIDVEGIPGDVDLPVRVHTYESDRARATVWLAHPSGLAVQAKHGLLTRAASAAGMKVRDKS